MYASTYIKFKNRNDHDNEGQDAGSLPLGLGSGVRETFGVPETALSPSGWLLHRCTYVNIQPVVYPEICVLCIYISMKRNLAHSYTVSPLGGGIQPPEQCLVYSIPSDHGPKRIRSTLSKQLSRL